MNAHARKAKLLILLTFILVLLISGLAACGETANAQPSAQPNTTSSAPDATTVVTTYHQLFNAGMKSGNFSAVVALFTSDATLTQSSPKGVTTVAHGLADITNFYQSIQKKFPGYQWTIESMRSLAPDVVLAYQHAGSPPLKVAGRCIHVFVVQNGKIASYDWATYYPGQP
jgi:SnoaL-like domain